MSLNSELVTETKALGHLVERLAQIAQDAGGEPDDILYNIMTLEGPDALKIGTILVDRKVLKISKTPIVQEVSKKPLEDLLKEANARFGDKDLDTAYLFPHFDANSFTGLGTYEIFRPTFNMSAYNVSKFCEARSLKLLSLREILHVVPKIDFSKIPGFFRHGPSRAVEGIALQKINASYWSLSVYPKEGSKELVVDFDRGSHSCRDSSIFIARVPDSQ